MTTEERFRAKYVVNTETGCWEWIAGRNNSGYGKIKVGPTFFGAHRLSYILHVGPIPAGLGLDHLCRVRHCVNPEHLEPVTSRENTMRGETPAATNAAKTCCDRGHAFSPENTHRTGAGYRVCRACDRDRVRARRAKP